MLKVQAAEAPGQGWAGVAEEYAESVKFVSYDMDADEFYIAYEGFFPLNIPVGEPIIGHVVVEVHLKDDEGMPTEEIVKTPLKITLNYATDWHEVTFAVSDWVYAKYVHGK